MLPYTYESIHFFSYQRHYIYHVYFIRFINNCSSLLVLFLKLLTSILKCVRSLKTSFIEYLFKIVSSISLSSIFFASYFFTKSEGISVTSCFVSIIITSLSSFESSFLVVVFSTISPLLIIATFLQSASTSSR